MDSSLKPVSTLFAYFKEREDIIEFIGENNQHTYKVNNEKLLNLEKRLTGVKEIPHMQFQLTELPYTSATTLIKDFFNQFDEDLVIKKFNLSQKNPKYLGMTPEQIKATWKKIRMEASKKGNDMHRYIDKILKHEFVYEKDYDEDAERCVDLLSSKLNQLEHNPEYVNLNKFGVFKSEWRVFHEEYLICGTIDCVLIENNHDIPFPVNKNKKRAIIIDWKRSKEIKMNNPFGGKGCHPITETLDDCNFNHYSLQLNIYKKILEEKYFLEVVEMFIVCINTDKGECQFFSITTMPATVHQMFVASCDAKLANLQSSINNTTTTLTNTNDVDKCLANEYEWD